MQEVTFEEAIEQILAADPRYQREAYLFVREALDFTQKNTAKGERNQTKRAARQEPVEHHVTGRELLEGIRQLALSPAGFGPMTMTVFAEWGISNCRDFGHIVFNMVDARLLRKTETDSLADFEGGYDFAEAFRKPFLPASKLTPKPAEPTPTQA
jgi:uncharacterized repeat protein (TIGR04138 family)